MRDYILISHLFFAWKHCSNVSKNHKRRTHEREKIQVSGETLKNCPREGKSANPNEENNKVPNEGQDKVPREKSSNVGYASRKPDQNWFHDATTRIKIKRNSVRYEKGQEELLNQCVSQTQGYDTESENELRHGRKSVTVCDINFDKVQKVDNKVEAEPPVHWKMADIKVTNFDSRIFQTTLKDQKQSLRGVL